MMKDLEEFFDICSMSKDEFIAKYGEAEYKSMMETSDDIKIRHEMYHDVYVYPDGHEEWISIGD